MEYPLCIVREATQEDLSDIMQMIQELAQHLNMIEEVTTDENALKKALFHDHKAPEIWVAEAENQVVGYMLFYHSFSTFSAQRGIYLEDLYIKEKCRSKGYGKAMMRKMCDLAKERNCVRIEWRALKENRKTIEVYKKIGAIPMENWLTFKLDEKGIDRLSNL